MTKETFTKDGKRRVVVQEEAFGFFTVEVGRLKFPLIGFITINLEVDVIGFAWPGFRPGYHILN